MSEVKYTDQELLKVWKFLHDAYAIVNDEMLNRDVTVKKVNIENYEQLIVSKTDSGFHYYIQRKE